MNVFYCAWLECIRKPTRSIVMMCIFVFIYTGIMIGFSLLTTAQEARKNVLHQIGSKITLYNDVTDVVAPITAEIIQALSKNNYVVDVNQSVADFAQPKNFENSKDSIGFDPALQRGSASDLKLNGINLNSIVIEGNTNTSLVDEFRLGYSKVIKGGYPTEHDPGVIIEQRLASVNHLQVGDELLVSAQRYNTELKMKVVGIYATSAKFEITEDNPMGLDIYAYSPYNRIFSNLEIALQLFQKESTHLPPDIFIDHPKHINDVGKEIKLMDIDWSKYQLINTTQTIYQSEGKQIDALYNYSRLILFYITSFGILILFLILSIWSKSLEYENGILLAIGGTNKRALLHFFITTNLISIIGFVISLVISGKLSSFITIKIIDVTVVGQSIISTFITGKEIDSTVQVILPTLQTYLILSCASILFIVISCLFPLFYLLKSKTRTILLSR